MTIVLTSSVGWLISHEDCVNSFYSNVKVDDGENLFKINPDLFQIKSPYKSYRVKPQSCNDAQQNGSYSTDVVKVKGLFEQFINEVKTNGNNLIEKQNSDEQCRNCTAISAVENLYKLSEESSMLEVVGGNSNEYAILVKLNGRPFLFPSKCEFYCKNTSEMNNIDLNTYDFILLDPPWRNKYIRRKKSKNKKSAYLMMYYDELKEIRVEKILSNHGTVVVWCTNSEKHQNTLVSDIFTKWNVKFHTKWYWLKVTRSLVPVCSFSKSMGKQPFELIFIGSRCEFSQIPLSKLVVSVPSALHSHKPPLLHLLEGFLPEKPKCLEIFARYLLPGWTSWGLEVLRFQLDSFYISNMN